MKETPLTLRLFTNLSGGQELITFVKMDYGLLFILDTVLKLLSHHICQINQKIYNKSLMILLNIMNQFQRMNQFLKFKREMKTKMMNEDDLYDMIDLFYYFIEFNLFIKIIISVVTFFFSTFFIIGITTISCQKCFDFHFFQLSIFLGN